LCFAGFGCRKRLKRKRRRKQQQPKSSTMAMDQIAVVVKRRICLQPTGTLTIVLRKIQGTETSEIDPLRGEILIVTIGIREIGSLVTETSAVTEISETLATETSGKSVIATTGIREMLISVTEIFVTETLMIDLILEIVSVCPEIVSMIVMIVLGIVLVIALMIVTLIVMAIAGFLKIETG
jgi:hypothetical protein